MDIKHVPEAINALAMEVYDRSHPEESEFEQEVRKAAAWGVSMAVNEHLIYGINPGVLGIHDVVRGKYDRQVDGEYEAACYGAALAILPDVDSALRSIIGDQNEGDDLNSMLASRLVTRMRAMNSWTAGTA